MRSFIISQFSCCPLIWMTQSRGINNKINHVHERALRIVYKNFSTPFKGLLAKDKSVTIHNQNLQQLQISFSDNNNYNLCSGTHLSRPILHTTHYGTE